MRQALAELGAREIPPLALAPVFLLVVIVTLWVPIRLSTPGAGWATATVVEKYATYAEDGTIKNLRYAFIVDDRDFTGTSLVYETTYANTNIGDPLPVRYAGSDPSVNRYVADYFVTAGEVGLSALDLVLMALLPVAWWHQRSVRRGRQAAGSVARGSLA